VVYGTHRLDPDGVARAARRYAALLTRLHDDRIDYAALAGEELCNGLLDPALDADAGGAPERERLSESA
jgi:hypothetical protein